MIVDYKAVLAQALEEYEDLVKQRQEIELKIAQKNQFICATMYQLPDEDRTMVDEWLDKRADAGAGLSGSIRTFLSANPKKWYTATEVRDALKERGFDFTSYSSNPLASVHSSLRRLKPEEAETARIEGVIAWRWKAKAPRRR